AKKLSEKKKAEYAEYDKAKETIGDYKGVIQKKRERITSTQYAITEQTEIKNKIAVLEAEIKKHNEEIAFKEIEIELYDSVSAMCAPTGAPAYVTDGIVETFNEAVDKYVDMV